MKNASMSRKITVFVIGMMSLVLGISCLLFSLLFLVGCGGDEEADAPEVSTGPNPLADGEEGVSPVAEVPPADDEEEVPAVDDGNCKIGDILVPGESCIDPGTGDTFSVLANGRGRYLFITAGTGITLRGSINGIRRNFVATKRDDGSWEIESVTPREDVGGNPVEVDNLEARCEIPPLNEDWKGKPVLFSGDEQGKGAILLSDGKFVVFVYKTPADPPPISVYGGPVQTATKALVQFAGVDFMNKDGVEIPDGEITEFEVSDAFVGAIDLEENRRILQIKLPEQKGETIKGDRALTMWLEVTGPCTLDINKVPPRLSAELTEYAKDLLGIMRVNPQ